MDNAQPRNGKCGTSDGLFRIGFSRANTAWCVTFLLHEIITQKKQAPIPGASHAVRLSFLSRALLGASGIALDPNAGSGASTTVNGAGRTHR
jgi:hypothetical protein